MKNIQEQQRGIIAWFAVNPVAANLLMVVIIILGVLSALHIRKEFFPVITTGRINISVAYPGASPEDVERGAVVKIEEALQGINGIKKVSSNSFESLGNVSLTILNNYDIDKVLAEIKTQVEGIANFPEEVKKPVISKETTRDGVLWLILSGSIDEKSLKNLAQHIKDDLIANPEISQVEIHGTRKREIRIELSEINMLKYGLSFDQVSAAIRKSSLNLPAGKIQTQHGELLLRTDSQAYTARDFAKIPVMVDTAGGTVVTLGEVAHIIDGFEEADWFLRFQGEQAVGLQIFRVGDQSSLDVAAAAHSYIQQKRAQLPDCVKLETIGDNSVMLKNRLQLMLKNLGFGSLLVFLSLILFLRLKVAFWVMCGLPLCFLGTIWLMPTPFIDTSINMITLFGFILVLGIVVDDAIVIGESIHTNIETKGGGVGNVIEGARHVATVATFGVLTTIAAFFPMLLIPGINGKIWRGIALVVILSLLFSLIESKLILPAHLSQMHRSKESNGKTNPLARLRDMTGALMQQLVQKIYQPLLTISLRNWLTTIACFFAILILTLGMIQSGSIKFIFFPDIEGDTIEANLILRAGTPLLKTQSATEQIEKAATRVNELFKKEEGYSKEIITSLIAVTLSPTEVWFYSELLPSEQRSVGANEIIRRWRAATDRIAGIESLEFSGSTADTGSPVSFSLKGNDQEMLRLAAKDLENVLSRYDGVHDTQSSQKKAKKEVHFNLLEGASLTGITNGDLARQIRQGFHGSEAQILQIGKDEIEVKVLYPARDRENFASLTHFHLKTSEGVNVPIAEIASKRMRDGYGSIDRTDGQRIIHVSANVNKDKAEPQKIIADIEKRHIPALLQKYQGLQYGLAGEAVENQESLDELKKGAILALLLIFVMMAIPLKSYLQPLIIMAVIPFGAVGAVLGHYFLGLPVSILSMCGIIALSGVVVNDSLVMVDFINTRRRKGQALLEAVQEAGSSRFRAIMLTSLTTFLGLLPMLLEKSLQAQFLIPMSVSLAFGILFATTITLILVPTFYTAAIKVRDSLQSMWDRTHGGRDFKLQAEKEFSAKSL